MSKKAMFGIKTGIILLISIFIVCVIYLIPKVKSENSSFDNSVSDFFEKDGNFFVYFSRMDCPYCDNIEKDIEKFAKENTLYIVDSETCNGTKSYDWEMHEKKYDVEIGMKNDKGEITFFNNMEKDEIVEKFSPVYYKILWSSSGYEELHEGKQKGKIYAICTHPFLEEKDLTKENFVLPAVPMLVEFDQHKVVNYYFDDKEIIDFLKSDTKPLNEYWNLD